MNVYLYSIKKNKYDKNIVLLSNDNFINSL